VVLTQQQAVGAAVRDLRHEKGVSQERLGELAELDRTYISGVERGVRNPTVGTLWRIADALETSLSDIVVLAEEIMGRRRR
jgi:transcriptional regulator with XRE-family HTH domain